MGNPTYTFRRPKPKKYPPQSAGYQPETLIQEKEVETNKYARYSFYILIIMFVLFLCNLIYIYFNGIPVKIRG